MLYLCIHLCGLAITASGSIVLYDAMGLVASAQSLGVIGDNTLPTPTVVTEALNGQFEITGGTLAGTNLFHSFSQFSIPQDGMANFQAPVGRMIENIFGRVTGASPSQIDGIIRSHSNATLFLLNPNGIIFGPEARLDVKGSFVGSTATAIQFADGQVFATNPTLDTGALLTVNLPVGLQFGDNPGMIINQSVNDFEGNVFDGPGFDEFGNPVINASPAGLTVLPNNTLALVGGPIEFMSGRVTAQGGRIELGSVGSNSVVSLTPIPQGWSLGYEGVTVFDDITLRSITPDADLGTEIDSSDGGSSTFQGRRITLLDSSGIFNFVLEESTVNGGDLTFTASEILEINDGSLVFSQVGLAPGANIEFNGGNIEIATQELLIENGGLISLATNGAGDAGNLSITASLVRVVGVASDGFPLPSLVNTLTGGAGMGGQLNINTNELIVQDGGQVSASTFGPGDSGDITIDAAQTIIVSGVAGLPSQIATSSSGPPLVGASTSAGDGGELTLTTGNLTVEDGAMINALTSSDGDGGTINITAESVRLDQGNLTAASVGEGLGGTLNITAETIRLDQGNLTASTEMSDGGNIDLQVSSLVELDNNSQITAAAGDDGAGGNINITTGVLLALPDTDSDIVASADDGAGGGINITTQGIFGLVEQPATPNNGTNDIDASSEFGVDGTIEINTLVNDPNSGLVTLPETPQDPSQQISTGCAAKQGNRFVRAGRGGLPTNPTTYLNSQPLWHDLRDPTVFRGRPSQQITINKQLAAMLSALSAPTRIVEATGWQRNSKGQFELVNQRSQGSLAAQGNPARCTPG